MRGAYRWLRWCGYGRVKATVHAPFFCWRLGLNDDTHSTFGGDA